jgi:hypothetical protein
MDRLKKKLKQSIYYLRYPWTINLARQSRFARGPQLCVHVISIISKLSFVASGSVLSHVISSIWFTCFH